MSTSQQARVFRALARLLGRQRGCVPDFGDQLKLAEGQRYGLLRLAVEWLRAEDTVNSERLYWRVSGGEEHRPQLNIGFYADCLGENVDESSFVEIVGDYGYPVPWLDE